MRKKKQLSKRISTKKREGIKKQIRKQLKKQRKDIKKKLVIPKSLLLTEEFKQHLEAIKKATAERTKAYYDKL